MKLKHSHKVIANCLADFWQTTSPLHWKVLQHQSYFKTGSLGESKIFCTGSDESCDTVESGAIC